MNLFLIVLSLILFYGNSISGEDNDELEVIDILSTIKSSSPNCDLRDFVESDEDYKSFTSDLTKYCSKSNQKKQCRILCNMIAYELKKGCLLDKKSRPSPVKYSHKMTPEKICGLKNVLSTDQWIWKAITNNGQKQISVTAKNLCEKMTTDTETLQLAKFFYKAAPRIRQADSSKTTDNDPKSGISKQTLGESIIKAAEDIKNTVKTALSGAKDKAEDAAEDANDKVNKAAEDTKKKISKATEDTKEKGSKTAKDVKKKVSDGTETVKDKMIETGKTASKKLGEVIETVKEKANDTISKIKKTLKTDDDATENNNQDVDKDKQKADDDDDDATTDKTKLKPKPKTTVDDDADDKAEENTDGTKTKTKDNTLTKIGVKTGNMSKGPTGKGTVDQIDKPATTGDEQDGKILDLKTAKKTDKNEDDDDDDDKDDTKDTKTNDDDQNKQIPKPGPIDKKGDQKTKVTDSKQGPARDPDDDDENEGGEEKISEEEARHQPDELDKNDLKPPGISKDKIGSNKDKDDIQIRKPTNSDKYTPKPVQNDPNKPKSRTKPRKLNDDGWSGSFITYFLLFTLFVVVGYLILHNKNKVLGLLIEGCRRKSHGRRNGSSSSSTRYQRLSQSS